MRKSPIVDPDGYIICRKCTNTYPRNNEYFSKNFRDTYGLHRICKKCDNKRRNSQEKLKMYHNIPKHCKTCHEFFYASKAATNKANRKNPKYKNGGSYCSIKCSPFPNKGGISNMRGKSWNGKRQGSNNPTAILNEDKVIYIRKLLSEGSSNKEIAILYGINRTTVSNIKTYKSWKHVK